MENRKNPPPDELIKKRPNTAPSTGQHQPAIQDEKSRKKRNGKPAGRDDINPEESPGNGNPEEYNDGEPVEEKSPRVSNNV